jgi:TP901 family phage tail tape measure protein
MALHTVVRFELTADSKNYIRGIDQAAQRTQLFQKALTKENERLARPFKALTDQIKKIPQALTNSFNKGLLVMRKFGENAFHLKNSIQVLAAPLSKLKGIVTIGAEFESQMTRVGVISKSTSEQLAKLTSFARYLGSTTKYSGFEVGKAMEYLALAGFSTNQILESTSGLLSLSAAAGEDLGKMADVVSDQLSAFRLHASEASRLGDAFGHAMSSANTSVSQLSEGLKYVSPVMATMGQTVTTTVSALSLLSNVAIKSSQAGTSLRGGMLRLVAPTTKAKLALEEYNIKILDAKGNIRNITDIFQDFNKSFTNVSAGKKIKDLKNIFGVEPLPGMIELINQSKVMVQEITVLDEKVTISTTNFKKFALENRLAQREGRMLALAMRETGTELKKVESFVNQYDIALNHQISTGDSLRKAFLSQGNASHELVAAFTVLGKQGISTSDSAKLLTGMIEEMIMPGKKAQAVFDQISQKVGKPFSQIQDFSLIITTLGDITKDMSKEQAFATYLSLVGDSGKKGAEALQSLVAESFDLEKVGEKMSQVRGISSEMAEKMSGNLLGSLKTLRSTTEELYITIFTDIAPTLKFMVEKLIDFVRWFTAIWPTLIAPIKSLASVIQNLSVQVSGAISSFFAFSQAFATDNFSSGQSFFTTFIAGLTSTAQSVYNAVLNVFSWIAGLLPHSNALYGPLNSLYESGQSFITTFTSGILAYSGYLYQELVNIFAQLATLITPDMIFGGLIVGLASLSIALIPIAQQAAQSFISVFNGIAKSVKFLFSSFKFLIDLSNLFANLAVVASNLSIVLVELILNLMRFAKSFSLLGIAAVFIYQFHTELVDMTSSLMALDFDAFGISFNQILDKLHGYWINTWVSAKEIFKNTFLGSIMTYIESFFLMLNEQWNLLPVNLQNILKSIGIALASIFAVLSRLPTHQIVAIVSDLGKAFASMSLFGKGILLMIGLTGKFFILSAQYPTQIQTGFNFIKDSIFYLINSIRGLLTSSQDYVNRVSDKISVLNLFLKATILYLMPIGRLYRVGFSLIGMFDILTLKVNISNKRIETLVFTIASFASGLMLAVAGGSPLIALITGLVTTVIVFRKEIEFAFTSAFNYWKEAPMWAKVALGGLVALTVGLIALKAGLISIPTLIIGAISGGITALGSLREQIFSFFREVFNSLENFFQSFLGGFFDGITYYIGLAMVGLGVTISALLIGVLAKSFTSVNLEKLAQKCVKNPMTACFVPNANLLKKQWANNKKTIEQGMSSLAPQGINCSGIGNCSSDLKKIESSFKRLDNQLNLLNRTLGHQEKNITAQSQRLDSFTDKLRNSTNQTRTGLEQQSKTVNQELQKMRGYLERANNQTRISWVGMFKATTSSIHGFFNNLWSGMVKGSQKAAQQIKKFIADVRFYGSDPDRKLNATHSSIINRAKQLATERGIPIYNEGPGRNRGLQSEQFKQLKQEAKKQAQQTRNIVHSIVANVLDAFAKLGTGATNTFRQASQSAAQVWQQMHSRSITVLQSLRQKVSEYRQAMARTGQQLSQRLSSQPATDGINTTNLNNATSRALREQEELMRRFGQTTQTTSQQASTAFNNIGQRASFSAGMIGKIGLAMTAVTGVTMLFSSSANAASLEIENLGNATENTSLKYRLFNEETGYFKDELNLFNQALAFLSENMTTVTTVAFVVLGTGLLDLTTLFSILSKTVAIAGAAFIGWEIGKFLYQFEAVQEVAITVVGSLVEFGEEIGEVYEKVSAIDFSLLGESLTNSIMNVFSEGLPQIRSSLNDFWSGLGDVFVFPADAFNGLREALGTAIGEAIGAISQGRFAEAGAIMVNGLIEGIQNIGSSLTKAVNGLLKMAVSAILPDSWAAAANRLIDTLVAALIGGSGAIVDAMQVGIRAAGSYISSVSWSGLGLDLLKGLISVFTGEPIIAVIKGMMNGANAYLAGLNWNTHGKSLLQTLAMGINAAVGLLIAAAKGAIQGVINYFSSLDLSESGRKMIATIGHGIADAGRALKQQALNVFNDVRQLLPFSDAREGPFSELTRSGQQVVLTMAKGVKKGQPVLKKSMEDAFNQAAETIKSLEKESATIGISSEHLKLYELRQKGVNKATLEYIGTLQSQVNLQQALFDATKKVGESLLSTEQLETNKLLVQGITLERAKEIRMLHAVADANKFLASTQEELNNIGRTPEQIKLIQLAEQGVSEELLEQIRIQQIGIAVAEKKKDLSQQIAYVKLTAYEKELEALRHKGANEEQINEVIALRTELERKKNETILRNADKELAFLKLSKAQQNEFNILKKFGYEYATQAQKEELLQKNQLIKVQKQQNKLWEDTTNTAGNYFEKILEGTLSAKDAFTSFTKDIRSQWAKTLSDMAKEQLTNLDFGKMFGSIGNMFSGKGGGGITSSLGGLFSSGSGGITSLLGSFFGGQGGSGDLLGGLTSSLGNMIPSVEGLTGALGGLGGSAGLGALSAGMSLLSGDTAGAVQGIASLVGSITPLGPLGGMLASTFVSMAGIGAKWVRESEWVVTSIRGMTAEFKKGFRETKKGFFGGGSRVGYEELNAEALEKLNSAWSKTLDMINQVGEALGVANDGLSKQMLGFQWYISAMEEKSKEWMQEQERIMNVSAIKYYFENMSIEGIDDEASKMLATRFQGVFEQVLTGTFSKAARQETWDGVLTKFVTQNAYAQGLPTEVANKLSERLQSFVDASAEQIKDMPLEQLEGVLNQEIGQAFTDIAVSIPPSITGELAQVLTQRVSEAVKFAAGDLQSSSFAVTQDKTFFNTLREMVREFEGSEDELVKLVSSLTKLKDTTHEATLSTDILTKDFITAAGGIEKASESIDFFGKNFVSEAEKQSYKLNDSLVGVGKIFTQLTGKIPKTREEFANLTRSMTQTGPAGSTLARSLLENAPAFDQYYKIIEKFTQSTSQTFQTLNQEVGQTFAQLGLTVPSTRAEFANLITGLDVTTESGQKLMMALTEVAPAVNSLFTALESVFSIDAKMLGQNLMDAIFSATSAEEAGLMMANRFAEEFHKQMIGTVMNSVSQMIFDGVVSPFLTSSAQTAMNITQAGTVSATMMTEGSIASATNVVQGGTVAGTNIGTGGEIASNSLVIGATTTAEALSDLVQRISDKMELMVQVFNQMKEQGTMDRIKEAMMDIGGIAFETVQNTPAAQFQKSLTQPVIETKIADSALASTDVVPSVKALVPTVQNVAEAADNMTESMNQVVSPVNQVTQSVEKTIPPLETSMEATYEVNSARQQFIQTQQEEIANLAEQAKQREAFNADIARQITEFNLGGLDLELFKLQQELENTKQAAIESHVGVAGLAKVEELYNLRRQKMIDDFNAEELTKLREFNTEIQTQIDEISLSGLDLELYQLQKEFDNTKQRAIEAGAGLSQVEELFGIKRQQIIKQYHEEEKQALVDFQQAVAQLNSGLDETQYTLSQLAKQYPLIADYIQESGVSYEGLVAKISQLNNEQLSELANLFGVNIEKFTTDMQQGLTLLSEKTEAERARYNEEKQIIGEFRIEINKLNSGLSDSQYALNQLVAKYPDITQAVNKMGLSYEDIIAGMSQMTDEKMREMANVRGIEINEFVTDIKSAIGLLGELAEQEKAHKQAMLGLQTHATESVLKLNTTLSDSELALSELTKKYPALNEALKQAGGNYEAVIKQISSLDEGRMRTIAKDSHVSIDTFVDDATKTIDLLSSLAEEQANKQLELAEQDKAQKEAVIGVQTHVTNSISKLNTSLSDTGFELSKFTDKYSVLDDALKKSGNNYEKVINQIGQLDQKQIQTIAKSANVSVDTVIDDATHIVDLLGSLMSEEKEVKQQQLEQTKAIREQAIGFTKEMDKFASPLSEAEYQIQSLTDDFPGLVNELKGLGSTSTSIAAKMSQMKPDKLISLSEQFGLSMDDLKTYSTSYINSLGTIESEKREQLKASQQAAKEAAEKTAQIAKENADKMAEIAREREESIKNSIDGLFDSFEKLQSGLESTREKLIEAIYSFETPGQTANRRLTDINSLQQTINVIPDINSPDSLQTVIDNINQLQPLLVEESKYQIDLINQRKDAAKQAFDGEKTRITELHKSIESVNQSIESDVFNIDKTLGKTMSATEQLTVLTDKFYQTTDWHAQIEMAEQLKQTVNSALEETITRIEADQKTQIEALKTDNEARIEQIKKLGDARVENLKTEQQTIKNLRAEITKVQDSINSFSSTLRSDMAKLAKDMNLPGTSVNEQLAEMRSLFSDNSLVASEDNINKLTQYKDLILSHLDEQISRENERFDVVKKNQQEQIEFQKNTLEFAKELSKWGDNLKLSDLSTYTNKERLDEARLQYETALKAAPYDKEAQANLTKFADTYLSEAQKWGMGYQDTFDTVQQQIAGLAVKVSEQSQRNLNSIPLDQTLTANNVNGIRALQEQAMAELKRVDVILNQIGSQVDERLAAPEATPLPDDQFDRLLAQQQAETERLVAEQNARMQVEETRIQQLVNLQISAARELAGQNLLELKGSLLAIDGKLQTGLEQEFNDTEFAKQITAIENETVNQLQILADKTTSLENSLTASLIYNVDNLALTIGENLRNEVGVKLSELIGATHNVASIMGNIRPQIVVNTIKISNDKPDEDNEEKNNDTLSSASYDIGTSYVPNDMSANVHKGEIIIARPAADILRQYGIEVKTANKRKDDQINNEKLDKIVELLAKLLEILTTQTQQDQKQRQEIQQLMVEMSEEIPRPIVNQLTKNLQKRK